MEERRKVAVEHTTWIKANFLAVLTLLGAFIWGLMQLSSMSGRLEGIISSLDKRVERLENRLYLYGQKLNSQGE